MPDPTADAFISETELICRCIKRDGTAFGVLYHRYKEVIYRYINNLVKDKEVIEDILQETFTRVWESMSSYDPCKSKVFTWILNIARYLIIDRSRSKSYRQSQMTFVFSEFENSEIVTDSYKSIRFNSDWIDLHDIVLQLEPRYIQLLDLIYFQGYTHVEVAEELAIPLGTVKTQLRMAVIVLRKHFL